MRPIALPLLVLALLVPASFAGAEDEAPKVPAYGAEDLAFDLKSLPDGWAACPEGVAIPESAPTEGMLMQLGEAVGLDEDSLFVETRAVKKGDQVAVASFVDVDTAPDGFRSVLEKSAEAGGWVMKDLGSPMRVLVVWSPDAGAASELAGFARAAAVYRLADTAWASFNERSIEGHRSGMERLGAARAIEEKAGVVAAVVGFLQIQQNRGQAVGAWIHALEKDTPMPPKGMLRVQVGFQLGQALLEAGRDELLEKALEVLLDATKHEDALDVDDEPQQAWMAYGNRYNLACTYSRMGKIDDAFKALEASFVFAKKNLESDAYVQSYNHCKNVDPDMSPLREDERFQKLMDAYDPDKASGS